MDLHFNVDKGASFTMEVGYFDTIQEIKEKVAKYHGILVHHQTLKFHGKTLPDDLNIHTSDILDGSHLTLITPTPTTATTDPQQPSQAAAMITNVKTKEPPSPSSCNSSTHKIKILLKRLGIAIEMNINDTILKLKEKINEIEGIPLTRMVVYTNGIELRENHKSLHECHLVDGSEVDITLKPLTPPPPPAAVTMTTAGALSNTNLNMGGLMGPRKLKVNVMSKSGKKIALEVNPLSSVGELRKELHHKINHQGLVFGLPEEGYFFIFKQNVMEEDQSFRWHRVAQGDTIEIFNGCVTGGS